MIKLILSKLSGKERILFLALTITAGIIILWPFHNFQYFVSQGDHGRDLYCFKKVMDGAVPYRDFSWFFGPLMPYYYSLCFLLGGVSIQSVLLGQILLVLLAGIFVFLTCSVFLPPAISFLCAFWYWSFRGTEFFYTYNHIGGLLALLIMLYCLFRYIQNDRRLYIYAGFISILALMLIRLNMGVFVLIAFVLSLLLTDLVQKDRNASKKRRLYLLLSFGILTITFSAYWLLLHSLPGYAIYQSFPYGKTQRVDQSASVLKTLIYSWHMIVSYFTATLAQKIFGILLFFASLQSYFLIFSKTAEQKFRKSMLLVFSSLLISLICTSHEFLASGVYYRIFWFFPVILILIFHLIATAIKNISSAGIKALLLLTLFLPPFWNIRNEIRNINVFKGPGHELAIGKNKIYTFQNPEWFQTVLGSAYFIKDNTRSDEKILVLPFDALYLFLSERDSATRQLVFFEHINIGEEQQRAIISELEKNGANWAIVSNHSVLPYGGMGVFGKTYCLLLAQYLQEHFEPVRSFGDWKTSPGWAWNHSVVILKRKTAVGE